MALGVACNSAIFLHFADGWFDIQVLPKSKRTYWEKAQEGCIFTAVESTAYYESYRHVLTGLQKIRPADFPFDQYIVRSVFNTKKMMVQT